ncbi:MAG TPA: VOC family protein [Ramlibacter sp.]|uniref:VOC family protein n=1 Tax=Ramlibacter sp. TaxID=1917967 RepID=UPI002BF416BD|nr:VOC family protein [Ramlibacter sp.]HVZ45472.1 VOC family protein [Ramlibacter sp.]
MQIETYLFFGGNCEEALKFYEQVFAGKTLALHRYGGSPMDDADLPAGWKDKVMHATFESEGARFMASDTMPGTATAGYTGFSMSVNLPKEKDKGERIFNALGQGGHVTMPFSPTFWGAHFGMVTDRFGVPWMVNCEG